VFVLEARLTYAGMTSNATSRALMACLCGSRNIQIQYSEFSKKHERTRKGMGRGLADTCPIRNTAKATKIAARVVNMVKILKRYSLSK
jgi:hypothetical protein